MKLLYQVPEDRIKRVIIDTDAACEADDPFAIAHALMSKKLDIRGILAEHYATEGSTQKSYDEICIILEAMNISVPVYMGEENKISSPFEKITEDSLSPASRFLIDEAEKEDKRPLYVLCLGAVTNIAKALKVKPEIAEKMTVVWIGGHSYDCFSPIKPAFKEFNAGNDINAANILLSTCSNLWQIPSNVYGTMHIGLAEIQRKIYPCGKIGKHLFENMIEYNLSDRALWTAGESWSLGDSPAVGVVLEPNCGTFIMKQAPIINEDTSYSIPPEGYNNRHIIKVYTSINSRFILEDFISKLEILYK